MIEAGRVRTRAYEGVQCGAVTCGVCGTTRSFHPSHGSNVRDDATREGWRICGEWGWCCPRCALGAPGLFAQQRNRRELRERRRLRRERIAARREERELPPERPAAVRGFGFELLGDVLDRLIPPDHQEEDVPE